MTWMDTVTRKLHELPAQYAEAETLAAAMLAAARDGDWEQVRCLQQTLPSLAARLKQSWVELAADSIQAVEDLENQRIRAIRRVLAIDAQVRRLADPRNADIERILAGQRLH